MDANWDYWIMKFLFLFTTSLVLIRMTKSAFIKNDKIGDTRAIRTTHLRFYLTDQIMYNWSTTNSHLIIRLRVWYKYCYYVIPEQ